MKLGAFLMLFGLMLCVGAIIGHYLSRWVWKTRLDPKVLSRGLWRVAVAIVVALVLMVLCYSDEVFAQEQEPAPPTGTSIIRLDAEPGGYTFWIIHEHSSGFTAEALVGTAGWGEMDVGWTFHTGPFSFLTLDGVVVSGGRVTNLAPLFITIFQEGDWYAEWWNVGYLDPRDWSNSTWYSRLLLTFHHLGPWVEGSFGKGGFVAPIVGGVLNYPLSSAFSLQLSVGVDVKQNDLVYRLTAIWSL